MRERLLAAQAAAQSALMMGSDLQRVMATLVEDVAGRRRQRRVARAFLHEALELAKARERIGPDQARQVLRAAVRTGKAGANRMDEEYGHRWVPWWWQRRVWVDVEIAIGLRAQGTRNTAMLECLSSASRLMAQMKPDLTRQEWP